VSAKRMPCVSAWLVNDWSPTYTRLIGVRFAWTPRQTGDSKPYVVKDLR